MIGGFLGIAAITFIGVLQQGLGGALDSTVLFPVAGAFGAGAGALLAPTAAFALMRRVPLWRAIVETGLGTVLGVMAGYSVRSFAQVGIVWPICGGIVGFLAAAIWLRIRSRGAGVAPRAS